MRQRKVCKRGHVFYQTPGCNSCPRCEAAQNKTRPTRVSVAAFLKAKATGTQLADCRELIRMFRDITGAPPRMWGPSIVGFGSYHYVYDSGREGDAPLLGFSPRKPKLVIYVGPCLRDKQLRKRLGRHDGGAGCLYVKTLADIDQTVLRQLAEASVAELRSRYA